MEVMLICDRCSFYCCHIYCCDPPLESIPLEDWFCKFCEETSNRRTNRRQARDQSNNRVRGQNNTSDANRQHASRTIIERSSTRNRNNQEQTTSNLTTFIDSVHRSGRNSTINSSEQTNNHRPQTRRATRLENNTNDRKNEVRYLTRSRTLDLSTTTTSNDHLATANERSYPSRYSRK
jgi:hypothetical protein